MTLLSETNIADGASKFFITMGFLMSDKIFLVFKHFFAFCALKMLIFGFVSIYGVTFQNVYSMKSNIADGASKFFITMGFLMSDKILFVFKRSRTFIT